MCFSTASFCRAREQSTELLQLVTRHNDVERVCESGFFRNCSRCFEERCCVWEILNEYVGKFFFFVSYYIIDVNAVWNNGV